MCPNSNLVGWAPMGIGQQNRVIFLDQRLELRNPSRQLNSSDYVCSLYWGLSSNIWRPNVSPKYVLPMVWSKKPYPNLVGKMCKGLRSSKIDKLEWNHLKPQITYVQTNQCKVKKLIMHMSLECLGKVGPPWRVRRHIHETSQLSWCPSTSSHGSIKFY